MKPLSAFFVSARGRFAALLPASISCVLPVSAQGLRFLGPPGIERFPGGASEWSASVSCSDPEALLGARVAFSLDADLDGAGDTAGAAALSPAGCEQGALAVRRPWVSLAPAVLRAELRAAARDSVTDAYSLLAGEAGSLLSIRRFCARPTNGEPEWIEIGNASSRPVSLAKVKLEGRALASAGSLDPGETLAAHAAADSAEMRLWRPGVRAFALSSWPGLRNSGDTLRLAFETKAADGSARGVALDSAAYGGAWGFAREACASTGTEEAGAAARGHDLEWAPGRWDRRAGPLEIRVGAPPGGTFDLVLYDLDGLEICRPARRAAGSQTVSLSSAACPGLRPGTTRVLILLRPRDAPSVRRLLEIAP